jgi:hypothetical protein
MAGQILINALYGNNAIVSGYSTYRALACELLL